MAKTEFKISDDIKEYHTENIIQDSVSVLEILKGKTQSEINKILVIAKKISEDNSVL